MSSLLYDIASINELARHSTLEGHLPEAREDGSVLR